MITQEIKLYDEPKYLPAAAAATTTQTSANGNNIITYNGYGKKIFTINDLNVERSKAASNNIKIGSRFRYIKGNGEIEVTSYETDPKKCEDIEGSPAVLCARRTHPVDANSAYTFHYTVAELLDTEYLERI